MNVLIWGQPADRIKLHTRLRVRLFGDISGGGWWHSVLPSQRLQAHGSLMTPPFPQNPFVVSYSPRASPPSMPIDFSVPSSHGYSLYC